MGSEMCIRDRHKKSAAGSERRNKIKTARAIDSSDKDFIKIWRKGDAEEPPFIQAGRIIIENEWHKK